MLLMGMALLGAFLAAALGQGARGVRTRPPWPPPPVKPPPAVPEAYGGSPTIAPAKGFPNIETTGPDLSGPPNGGFGTLPEPAPAPAGQEATEQVSGATGPFLNKVPVRDLPAEAEPVEPVQPAQPTEPIKTNGDSFIIIPEPDPKPSPAPGGFAPGGFAEPSKKLDDPAPRPKPEVPAPPGPTQKPEVLGPFKNPEVPEPRLSVPTPLKMGSNPVSRDAESSERSVLADKVPEGRPLVGDPGVPTSVRAFPAATPAPAVRTAVPIGRRKSPEPSRAVVTRSTKFPEAPGVPASLVPKSAGPMLTLEKHGPSSVSMGQPLHYEIVVQNLGSEPAPQVRVEDELGDGLRYLGGNPQPVLQGNRVVWNLDQVAPGARHQLCLDVQASSPGEVFSQTSASLGGGVRTRVTPSGLEVSVTGPGKAVLGQTATIEITLKNVSQQKLSGVLQVKMPAGLRHLLGENIEADIHDLEPGAERKVPLPAEAKQPGRHVLEVHVRANDGQEAVAQGSIFVGEPGLSVQLPSLARVGLDRDGELSIEVANFSAQPARNIAVTDTLPEGLDYAAASDRGYYRSVTRSIHWLIDYLPPGQAKVLKVKCRARTAGPLTHHVTARSQQGLQAQAEGSVVADGQARLSLKVSGRDKALEVGRETVYEVRVINEGTSADTNIELRTTLPQGMLAKIAQGPTSYRIEGQTIVFDTLARLDGRMQAIYLVTVQAQAAGDRRLRAEVTSQQLRSPLVREERTVVYRD